VRPWSCQPTRARLGFDQLVGSWTSGWPAPSVLVSRTGSGRWEGAWQWLVSISYPRDQIALERRGAHTLQGLSIRVAQRLVTLAPQSDATGILAPRSTDPSVAYDQ
jgi:hypothetical protein